MKYAVKTTKTSVIVREVGVIGSLEFGVGGPIAAEFVRRLAEEVNQLRDELAAAQQATRNALAVVDAFRGALGNLLTHVEMIGNYILDAPRGEK